MSDLLIYMLVGSFPCGTAIPTSDTDYRGIHRTTANIIPDNVIYSLPDYVSRILIGEIVPLEMLFLPEIFWKSEPAPLWYKIKENKDKIISKQMHLITTQCKVQFLIHGIKGVSNNYLVGFISFLDLISKLDETKQIKDYVFLLKEKVQKMDEYYSFLRFVDGNKPFFEIAGRMYFLDQTVRSLKRGLNSQVNYYTKNTEIYQKGQGYIKKLYHAARDMVITHQLLTTGVVTYPLPEYEYLLGIRKEKIPYKRVIRDLEDFALNVDDLMKKSALAEKPDYAFIETLYKS